MQMDPEQMAKEETDRLDKLVNLTPKQYQKWEAFEAQRDFRRIVE